MSHTRDAARGLAWGAIGDGPQSDREPWLLKAIVEALVQATIVGVIAGLVVSLAGPPLAARLAQMFQEPSCSDTRHLDRVVPVDATATSVLADEPVSDARRVVSYGPTLLYDGDTGTSWVEGDDQFGAGESVTLIFENEVDIELSCVANGYALSWDLYQRNGRVRGMDIKGTSGSAQNVTLQDAGTSERPAVFQEVRVDLPATDRLELLITSAYTSVGKTRYADTCISEIEVWTA